VQAEHLVLRPAHPSDAGALTGLALRSKGHWGYSAEFLEACREELTVRPERIGSPDFHVTVAEDGGRVAGFYALRMSGDHRCELDALFVDPSWIGAGLGRRLLDHAKDLAGHLGAVRIKVQSDPGAVPFYIRAGATATGTEPSGSIPGRDLPVLEFVLQDGQ
jgi:GNAT superfamily N-acetyltransferase